MKTFDPTSLGAMSGEELLLMRIFRPHLGGLIEQELERRSGGRRLAAKARGAVRVERRAVRAGLRRGAA
jgi:hypothetical protein